MCKIVFFFSALLLATPAAAEVFLPRAEVTSQPASMRAASQPAPMPAASRPASMPAASRPMVARARREPRAVAGSLAVVNLGRRGALGWSQVRDAHESLLRYIGGAARTPSIAASLAGNPAAGVLPEADVGRRLGPLLERLRRGGRPSIGDLFRLGRLLGVDYLLLMRVRGVSKASTSISARIFSVHRQEYAPQGFERHGDQSVGLKSYVRHQILARKRRGEIKQRWWVWAVAGAVAAVTLVLSALSEDEEQGTLKIRVKR